MIIPDISLNKPAKGAEDWHVPLNENFGTIEKSVTDLAIVLDVSVTGGYSQPSKGTLDWDEILNGNFTTIESDLRALADAISNPPDVGGYPLPEHGQTDWHVPLNDTFTQIEADVNSISDAVATGKLFEVIATSGDSSLQYRFTADGKVWPADAGDGNSSIGEGNDTVTQQQDGTYEVTGETGTNLGDAFVVEGDVLTFEKTTGESGYVLLLDGSDVTDEFKQSDGSDSGNVTVIQRDQHPNLYFDANEIQVLREAIIQNQQPTKAWEAYSNFIRGHSPSGKPSGFDSAPYWPDNFGPGQAACKDNMKACVSYMLEPSQSKATELRDALIDWTADTNPYWTWAGQESGWIHFSLAWMYDLVLGYHPDTFSSSDISQLEDWFAHVGSKAVRSNSFWTNDANVIVQDREGSVRETYPNWYNIQVSCGAVSALVSHDQSLVDKAYNSDVPATHYDTDLSAYAGTRDIENLVTGEVFPGGYTWDGYDRNYGFNAPNETFDDAGQPDAGSGQGYHFFATWPLFFAMEGATHNGEDAWHYGDGIEAMLEAYTRASSWAHTAYVESQDANRDRRYLYRMIYRRYPNNATFQSMVDAVPYDHTTSRPIDKVGTIWEAMGEIQ